MRIVIHCTDASEIAFNLDVPQAGLELLKSLKPAELFNQPQLRVQRGKGTLVINTDLIDSIHFITDLDAGFVYQGPDKSTYPLGEAQYRKRIAELRRHYAEEANPFTPGSTVMLVVALHCLSGQSYYLESEFVAAPRMDQLLSLNNMLTRINGVIPLADGGYVVINPKRVKYMELYPAPVETPATAWLL